MAIYKTS